jgi:hypothetical protein
LTEDLTRECARQALLAHRAWLDAEDRAVEQLELAGRRIVCGGQTSSPDKDGNSDWEITDWRTGQVLASGHGTHEDYFAATEKLDPDGRFVHRDHVGEDVPLPRVPVIDGLPASLAEKTAEWAMDIASAEELAAWTGWPVAEVRRCWGT